MSRKVPRRFWLLGVPVGLALVASVMVPLALAQGKYRAVSPRVLVTNHATSTQCTLQENTPSHPLELNMETLGPRFKTIAMEKEVFQCPSVTGGDANTQSEPEGQVVDVETFIEIVERAVEDDNGDNGRVVVVERRVEVARCVKDFNANTVDCSISQRQVPRVSQTGQNPFNPLTECTPKESQPDDPVAMATEENEGFVKTVKVEKEHLSCTEGSADLYLFTEIIEAQRRIPGTNTTSIRPVQRRFDAFFCAKRDDNADIEGCLSFNPVAPKD